MRILWKITVKRDVELLFQACAVVRRTAPGIAGLNKNILLSYIEKFHRPLIDLFRISTFCTFHPEEKICRKFPPHIVDSHFNEKEVLATSTCKSFNRNGLQLSFEMNQTNSPCRIDIKKQRKVFIEEIYFGSCDQNGPSNFIWFNQKPMEPQISWGNAYTYAVGYQK